MTVKTKKKGKKALIILASILGFLIVATGICAVINLVGIKSNENFISVIEPVKYENQLTPILSDDGNYTFTTDGEFKVMQLTDVHIGGGFMSIKKDSMAINAVASMISEEKPDLVVVSGDIAYPVPFQAGTFNNKNAAKLFADLMEELGVYWCPAFGNHDTESYSYYTREDMGDFYESADYPHCLFQKGPEDIYGCGNYVVNVKNTAGKIVQSIFVIDSNDYIGNGLIGSIAWKYDFIHEDQINWYKETVAALTEENGGETPKSVAFFHIPLIEYLDAWTEYTDNGNQDTENVKYYFGKVGESGSLIYSSKINSGMFETARELGSTQGFFCGHDHLNNFSLDYKGIRLTYGYSVDYLAYAGIMKYGAQRGCTIINIAQDGSFETSHENYYQDKYSPVKEKEQVKMEDYYS